MSKSIPVGSRWREKRTGRLVEILEEEVHGTGPAWQYVSEDGKPEPHGYEKANGFIYDDWYWHYCDALDFVVFGRFERVTPDQGESLMSVKTVYYCDQCGAVCEHEPFCVKVGRRMDNEVEMVDLCAPCMKLELDRILSHMTDAQRADWVSFVRKEVRKKRP